MALKLNESETVERKPLLSIGSNEVEMTDEAVGDRAVKLDLLLGPDSPGQSEIANRLSLGYADDYKRLLAEREKIRQLQTRNDILEDIATTDPKAITPEIVQTVQGLSDVDLTSPDIADIIEREYARTYTNVATAELENDIVDEAIAADPDAAYDSIDRAERVAYKKEVIATEAAKIQKEIEGMSLGSKVWNFTERMIPFVEWYQKINQVGEESDFVSSILPGSNLQEQYSYLWLLEDPKQFRNEVMKAVEDLKERNPYVAESWLEGLVSYGGQDAVLDNILAVADVVDTAALPIGVLKNALKGVARGAAKSPKNISKIATDLGKYEDAAIGKVVDDLQTGKFLASDAQNVQELENAVPSLASPLKLLERSQSLPQAAYLRIKQTLMRNAELAQKFLLEPNLIERASPEELLGYRTLLREDYIRQNPSIQNNVIDVEIADSADIGNVYQAKVVLGQRDGTLFESQKAAENYQKRFMKLQDEYQIEQVGQGFRIVIPKTVDESRFLTDLRLPSNSQTPESFANQWLGLIRSADYLLSDEQNLARSTAVTSSERMASIVEDFARPLQNIPKKELQEVDDLIKTDIQFKKEYKNYQEFEDAFFNKYLKNPTTAQTEAYFTMVQLNDLDYVVRNLDWYKQKVNLGGEQLSLKIGEDTVSFEGQILNELPHVRDGMHYNYVVVRGGKPGVVQNSRVLGATQRQNIQKLLDQGYKIVAKWGDEVDIGKRSVRFIVTDGVARKRLGVKAVDRQPGGHKVDTYSYYLKQGKLKGGDDGVVRYRGDTTLFGFKSEKDAREFTEVLETARKKYAAQEPDARAYIRDNFPGGIKRWEAAVAEGLIDLKTPFAYTRKGSRTIDMGAYRDIRNLQDVTRSPYDPSSRLLGRYAGQRDMSNIDVIQSEGDLKFSVGPAEYLSPIDTLRSASSNMISVRARNDYTLVTTRNFIREFGDILDGTLDEQIANAHNLLVEPKFKSGASPARVAAAKNVSRAYKNFLNMGSDVDRLLDSQLEKIINPIENKFRSGRLRWVPSRVVSTIKEPGVALRSFAFDLKLGMFNPKQFFVQANSLVNIFSIGGIDGLRGGLVYAPFRMAAQAGSPEVVKAIANAVSKTGVMSADEFLESYRLYIKSGYHLVGKDTAFLDDIRGPEIVRSPAGQAIHTTLSWGRTPFQEGERVVRIAAWNAAYLEKKKALKGKAISRRDEAEILKRAKDLGANMSRESNAAWQKGYASVFTQFFGYQARLTEQLLGKKLTRAERLRLFVGLSAVYGLPVGAGALTGVIPVREIIIDQLLQMGIDPDSDPAIEAMVDGFASAMIEYIVGDERELNIAGRYGPGGLPNFWEFLSGDADAYELFLGASGSIALQTATDAWPFLKAVYSSFLDFDGSMYKSNAEDMVKPFRNISTINDAVGLWQVYNLGIWASRNGVNIAEMDLPQAVVAVLTGLQPAAIEEGFQKNEARKGLQDWMDSRVRHWANEYRKALKLEGPEYEMKVREIQAGMTVDGLDNRRRAQAWKWGTSKDILSDSFAEKWQEELDRYNRRRNGVQP